MPIEYLVDHVRQRLTIIGRDPIGVPDVLACLERQAAEGAWAYQRLDDLRLVTWNPTTGEVRRVLHRIERLSATHGPRGPVAVVAAHPALFGMARMSASLGDQAGVRIEAFYDLAEAERWLDERTRATGDSAG